MSNPRTLAWALVGLLCWLVGYPLVLTLFEAFGGVADPTVANFAEFLGRSDEWRALWRSAWLSVLSVVLAAVVGVPLGFVFERTEFPGRRLLGVLVALPVALPPLVGVIAFLFLYGESGFLARGLQALGFEVRWTFSGPVPILLVHTYSFYVYFYLMTRAGLARLDAAKVDAARSLGASEWRILRRVTLPLLRPSLAGASVLTFMTALASFSAPYIFGGGFRVMPTQIVSSKLNGETAMAQVETVMLGLLALGGLALLRRLDTDADLAAGERGLPPARARLHSPLARGLAAAAGWTLTVILLLPHLTLLLLSLVPPNTWTTEALPPVLSLTNYGALLSEPERLRPMVNSLWMATVATALAIGLAVLAARSSLRVRGRLGAALGGLLLLPWAIPGTVFAIALATCFSVQQPWALRFVLVGTSWILPLAYLVRSLPVTGSAITAGLRQMDGTLEEASASLGASGRRTFWRVVLPLLRPALLAGGGLALVTALGDFVVSINLYTFETRPIAIEILSSLRLQETGVAAAYGVFLMILSAVVFLLWSDRLQRS
ncbi:MAG: iron ABC transporter permease [Acidobacteriota bacterium]